MIVAPAVDLRGGRCVQLVGGRPDREAVSLPDPLEAARRWWTAGFGTLHVVDLDAALDEGANEELVLRILADAPEGVQVQVGGGVRSGEKAARLLDAGARRVIVGTRAVREPQWLESLVDDHPGRIMVAADILDGEVLTRGWTEGSGHRIGEVLARFLGMELAGVLCTDVAREGRVEGIDLTTMGRIVTLSETPVWVSGGVGGMEDLRDLEETGAAGAVVGMALYTGALDAERVAREFGRAAPTREEERT